MLGRSAVETDKCVTILFVKFLAIGPPNKSLKKENYLLKENSTKMINLRQNESFMLSVAVLHSQ